MTDREPAHGATGALRRQGPLRRKNVSNRVDMQPAQQGTGATIPAPDDSTMNPQACGPAQPAPPTGVCAAAPVGAAQPLRSERGVSLETLAAAYAEHARPGGRRSGKRARRTPTAPHGEGPPELSTRLALRQEEAAAALGIAVSTLREITPDLPHVRVGRVLLYPRAALERWLEEQAARPGQEVDRAVAEMLGPRRR